jgi:hypothetical protein
MKKMTTSSTQRESSSHEITPKDRCIEDSKERGMRKRTSENR